MDPLNAFDIARYYRLIEEIDLYITLINNGISPHYIEGMIQNSTPIDLYMEHLHKMVYLAGKGVDADIICKVDYTFFDPMRHSNKKPKEELYKMIDESENIVETLKQYFQSNE
jgi:hypothetical protein